MSDETWMKDGGRHLKLRRVALDMTLAEVGAAAGKSTSTISRYERGELSPLGPAIPALASALQVESLTALYMRGEVEEVS